MCYSDEESGDYNSRLKIEDMGTDRGHERNKVRAETCSCRVFELAHTLDAKVLESFLFPSCSTCTANAWARVISWVDPKAEPSAREESHRPVQCRTRVIIPCRMQCAYSLGSTIRSMSSLA